MRTKKIIKRIILFLLLVILGYAVYYAWFAFPIISGYSAKNACSCVFIQGRTKEDINKEELGSLPLSIGEIAVDYKDSSVTGTVLGLAKRKAIFRTGFGCTLANEFSESAIRAQQFSLPAAANPDSMLWPMGGQLPQTADTTIDQIKLDSALGFVFNHSYNEKPVLTRAVVIVHKGNIIAEQYGRGYNQNSKFLGWSMAKSVTSALIGILVKEGKLNVSQPAPVAQWRAAKDARNKITLEHLLQQTSGLNFVEDYASHSNATNMLFNKGDMAGYVASLPVKDKPGSRFYYSSGNSNVLSGIIRTIVGQKDYHAFPYKALFHKIGMHHTLMEPDASGTFVGSSYIYASARDYARFGLLYLNDGVWNGERILPEGWVKKTTTAPAANKLKNYGYQFWLNGFDDSNTTEKAYPGMPDDLFMADGYGGQRIYIIPSRQLVIVRMGLNKFDEHTFLKLVMAAL